MAPAGGVSEDPDDAFEAFFRQREAALFRLSVVLTGDESAGADLLQTVLARVYARWAAGPWPAEPEAYLRTALVHAAGQFWRRRSRNREVLVAEPPEMIAGATTDLALRGALLAALRRLPVRQRAVVALRYFEDYSEREVAEILDCQVGTVKSQAHRALRKLRSDPQLADFFDTVMET